MEACEVCSQAARLICFCRKALLCEKCVGRHLMQEPSLSHKPCALESEEAKVYATHMRVFKAKEEEFLAGARVKREFVQSYKRKLAEGVEKLRALRPVIIDYVSLAMEVATKQLPDIAEKLGQELLSECDKHIEDLETAICHFEGGAEYPNSDLVLQLDNYTSVNDIEAAELVKCQIDLTEMPLEEVIRRALRFEIAIIKPQSVRLSEAIQMNRIPVPSKGPAKRPSYRPESKRMIRSRAHHSLNTSLECQEDQRDPLQAIGKNTPFRAEQPDRDLLLLGKTGDSAVSVLDGEEDFIKLENPSPEPPKLVPGLRRFTTETALEKGKFTRLQSARIASRKAQFQQTERKLAEIEQQVKAMKASKEHFQLPALSGDSFDPPATPECLGVLRIPPSMMLSPECNSSSTASC